MENSIVGVLIADDQAPFRKAARAVVTMTPGFEVVGEAETGETAVEMVEALEPNLVLMDIGLPQLDGWQASRILKSDPLTCKIPLIAFSAHVDSTADLIGRSTFDGYILKPVSPTELVRRVDAYLQMIA